MWMAFAADYAPSSSRQQRNPSPWVAGLLTLLAPGLGHLYLGQPKRGILLFALVMIADTLLMFAMMGVLARFWMFAISGGLLFGLWLYILVDAVLRARHTPLDVSQSHSRWTIYAGAFLLACLVFAAPCIYALQAKASGRLLWLSANSPSMEPTLETGEYILADATYYKTRLPSRGDVAVYKHPMQPDSHLINRIVAIEGDRIAIKNGHAIVNGMFIEEPYAERPVAGTAPADVPEIRVPAGYVFVMGDNRASGRGDDLWVQGLVPVTHLIGRVTDVAISRHLMRLGRWIGTPSN
jgi:signal peptidase I